MPQLQIRLAAPHVLWYQRRVHGELQGESATAALSGIRMEDVFCDINKEPGLIINPGIAMHSPVSISINGFEANGNGGLASIYLMNSCKGEVKLSNIEFKDTHQFACLVRAWDSKKMKTRVTFSLINGQRQFPLVIADRPSDPFPSDVEHIDLQP
eukprot:TRINITY_DN14762_c0_g2_i1.p1 TRINITY_DN14762_c0_g2~~TRINITY_DN14762_c0_g2_i1.p1  ORF type:complete len:155 (-),score=20.62 TRINITY_DN14762_c0_g2_i1:194-658(-)